MFRFSASAAALLLSSTASFADITAEEAWADLRALLEGSGQSLTVGSEAKSGNTLTVQDIVIDMSMADATSSASLDQIAFVERGDGTVEIVLSPDYRIVSRSTVEGETVEVQVTMTHSALSLVVAGDATEKTYTYSAASVGAELSELAANDDAVPVALKLDVTQPSGTYVSRVENGGRALDSTFAANGMQLDMSGTDDTSGTFAVKMDLGAITGDSQGFLPQGATMEDMAAYLRAGFFAKGTMTYASSTYAFDGNVEGSQSTGSGKDEGGSFDFAMGADGLSYGALSRNASFTMKSSDIRLPEVAFGYQEGAFRVAMPITASDTPQDFGLLTSVRGLTVSDGIWALFDPMGALPRDPATIAVDLAGKARWFVDIFNPEAAASAAVPGELSALTVNSLEVSLVGAALTGTGDFTFDNTDTATFGGMPRPQGAADLKLTGGNTLLDKLVSMGLIPEDQATGMRMMLGLFARPGDGDDVLVSKIEVTADGQVLANGQRIR